MYGRSPMMVDLPSLRWLNERKRFWLWVLDLKDQMEKELRNEILGSARL